MKQACANCRWYEELPFADEFLCTNENSDYADCPSDNPEQDTCEYFEPRE